MAQKSCGNPECPTLNEYGLRIEEYRSPLYEKVMTISIANLREVKREAKEESTRRSVDDFIEEVREDFQDVKRLVHAQNGGKMFVVMTTAEDVVGVLGLSRSERNVIERSIEYMRISVAREWQKRGIGRAMMDHALRYARANFEVRRIVIYTLNSFCSAIAMYRKMGLGESWMNLSEYSNRNEASKATTLVKAVPPAEDEYTEKSTLQLVMFWKDFQHDDESIRSGIAF